MFERLLKRRTIAVEDIKFFTGIDLSNMPIVVRRRDKGSSCDGSYREGVIYLYGMDGVNAWTLIHEYVHYLVDQKFYWRDDDYVMLIAEEIMAEAAAKALLSYENPFAEGVIVNFIRPAKSWFLDTIDCYAENFETERSTLVKIMQETSFETWSEIISSLMEVIKK